jgi:glycerophosphoryl diester phosphodiesterase
MAAFRKAVEMGADGVELDVHLSADGVPVVIHDFTVDSTTDGSGRVAEQSLAQLLELDAGFHFDPQYAGERIPTLEEVFAEVGQQLLINVEMKVMGRSDYGMGEAVAKLVHQFGLEKRIIVSSFNPFALRALNRAAPQLPLGLLYSPLPYSWLARFLAWTMRDLSFQAVHPHVSMANRAAIQRAHALARQVITWTVDDADQMRKLAAWGVDGIITNHPDRLRDVLAA